MVEQVERSGSPAAAAPERDRCGMLAEQQPAGVAFPQKPVLHVAGAPTNTDPLNLIRRQRFPDLSSKIIDNHYNASSVSRLNQ